MFARISNHRPSVQAGSSARLVVALLAAVAGCDREPRWRGVGTDAGDTRPAPNHDADPGGPGHGNAR